MIHSNKSQNYRLNTLAELQKGNLKGIITTDIMARGLDIRDISHVINFEVPEIAEQYIHRIGRTGRADKDGTALTFVSPREEEWLLETEILMNLEIKLLEIPKSVEISTVLMEFEKKKQKSKLVTKRPDAQGGNGAFHEKKDKNKKVNLGGPGKRNPRKTKPTNRGQLKRKK